MYPAGTPHLRKRGQASAEYLDKVHQTTHREVRAMKVIGQVCHWYHMRITLRAFHLLLSSFMFPP